jgi:hypothetical protein
MGQKQSTTSKPLIKNVQSNTVSVIVTKANGEEIDLGELNVHSDVNDIKRTLASVSGLRKAEMLLYIIDDNRRGVDDLTLNAEQKITSLTSFTKIEQQQQQLLLLALVQIPAGLTWQNVQNICTDDGSLEKIGGDTWSPAWDAGSSSIEIIATDSKEGGIEWTIETVDKGYMIGLSHQDKGIDFRTIEFAVRMSSSGNLVVYERGRYVRGIGPYKVGDRIGVRLQKGAITYTHNDEVRYTSTQVPKFPLLADTSFKVIGAKATSVCSTN